MKKLFYTLIIIFCSAISFAQTQPANFRLHIQPGKPELNGDGDDYTTLVISARDDEGEIIQSMNGTVTLRCSAGFIESSQLKMTNGIAYIKYTAPIFGQSIKAAQRMVYFMVKFIRKFTKRSQGSTDMESNKKLATQIAIENFKEGDMPLTLIPKKEGDDYVYFVCEMNGVKGKTKIKINKASENGGNLSIVPGYYSGYDITGSAHFELEMESGGKGQMRQNGTDPMTVLFTTEKSSEINSAMKKMMGGGEWMNAYMGASEKDMKYMPNYDVKQNGMPSIYMPMPNNGIFIYVPPILLEYQGRISYTNASQPEKQKQEKTFITVKQNELIGDGKSQTEVLFHYEDEKGIPVAGKNISWSIPKDIRIISSQNVTDASGNAIAVIQAPVLKATEEKRGENTGELIDNYNLYKITVNFSSAARQNDYCEGTFAVYKTIEKNIRILKPGFDIAPVKILLPQLENYTLESNINALVEMVNSPSIPDKIPVQDAIIFFERKKFDADYFNSNYNNYFKKDRKFFITMLDDTKGGFMAITDKQGNFKLQIGSGGSRVMKSETIQTKLSELTAKRQGELAKVLKLFENEEFEKKMIENIYELDKSLCELNHNDAVCVDEKLHILGNLMANTNSTSAMLNETIEEVAAALVDLLRAVAEFANEHYHITETIVKENLLEEGGSEAVKFIYKKFNKEELAGGVKAKIYKELYKRVFSEGYAGKIIATKTYVEAMKETVNFGVSQLLDKLLEGIAEYISKEAPTTEKLKEVMKKSYYEELEKDVELYMASTPASVHVIYEKVQPILKDRSAEIGAFYQSVGKFRMDMGLYKADKDFFVELSKGAVIIGTVLVTHDPVRMEHINNTIDKCSKVVDGLFAVNNVAHEIWNYSTMLDEVRSAFRYVNKSIGSGGTAITFNNYKLSQPRHSNNYWLISSATAQEKPANTMLPGIVKFNGNNSAQSSTALNQLYSGYFDLDTWFENNKINLLKVGADNNKQVAKLMKYYDNYDRNLFALALIDAINRPDDAQVKQYRQKYIAVLSTLSDSLSIEGKNTIDAINNLPKTEHLGNIEPSSNWSKKIFTKNNLIYGGSALGAILIATVSIIFIRRKRKNAALQEEYFVQPTYQQAIQTQEESQIQSSQETIKNAPKFCPQCGSAFKEGAKFCGNCGWKAE